MDWPTLRSALAGVGMEGAGDGAVRDVLVRPEHVRHVGEGMALRVVSCVFEGERFALSVALPDGQSLKAYGDRAIMPGDTARFVMSQGWRL